MSAMALYALKFKPAVLLCCAALTLTEACAAQSTPSPLPSSTLSTTEEWTATLDFKGEKLISREDVIQKAAASVQFHRASSRTGSIANKQGQPDRQCLSEFL